MARSGETPAAAPPAAVAPFELRDYRGKIHAWPGETRSAFTVVVMLGTDCPLVRLYAPRLAQLAAEFDARGVRFLGVNANRQDTLTKIGHWARQAGVSFPVLKDGDQRVMAAFGATRTPEVFLLDAQGRVRYHGRVDDQYGVGVQRRAPLRQDLRIALEQCLAGQEVSQPVTELAGCLIGRLPSGEPGGGVTYSNQIARLLEQRCVECHRAGQIGPFPLTNYDEVAGWADMIGEVVQQRRMPPWFADPAHGQFLNSARLSDEEVALIESWVTHGAPEGDRTLLPPPRQYVDGWRIDQPDLVVHMSQEPFVVQAEGVEDYQTFEVDPGFTEDRWIQAAEARPGNRSVVHHHLAYFVVPGEDRQIAQVKNQIAGYAPGTPPFVYPPGTALRIPKGAKILFQMHYTPVGTEQTDRSSLGLIFADPASVQHEVRNEIVGNIAIRIPPGASDYHLAAKRRFRREVTMINLAPHMHLRGRSFRFELELADGSREVLLDVPRYDFNWQLRYDLAEPRVLPAGSRLHCFAGYDNSADNPANPDPTAEVTFGEQTSDEMMFGVFQTVVPVQRPSAPEPGEERVGLRKQQAVR